MYLLLMPYAGISSAVVCKLTVLNISQFCNQCLRNCYHSDRIYFFSTHSEEYFYIVIIFSHYIKRFFKIFGYYPRKFYRFNNSPSANSRMVEYDKVIKTLKHTWRVYERRREKNNHSSPATAYLNRDLSWIEFNRRVLLEAQDLDNPLMERAKFLAIVSSNLDEFISVRVAGIQDQIRAGYTKKILPAIPPPDCINV